MSKSSRNKTISTSIEEGKDFLARCVKFNETNRKDFPFLNKTILGDMLEVCPRLPPQCADLIITDPPYNLTKSFNGNVFGKKSMEKYAQYTRTWLNVLLPLLKENGTIYVCCDWNSSLVIGSVLQESLYVRNRITWQREKGRGAVTNWKNSMEDIWFATKSNNYTFHLDAVKIRRKVIAPYRADGTPKDWCETPDGNYRDTCPSNFWDDITVPFWSMPENTLHPTQKPEKLMAKLILASSSENDVILDPFAGSGTTAVTAKKLHRNYIGIEKEAQYCVWAEQRLAMAETSSFIQGYSDGVFYERNSAPSHGN